MENSRSKSVGVGGGYLYGDAENLVRFYSPVGVTKAVPEQGQAAEG